MENAMHMEAILWLLSSTIHGMLHLSYTDLTFF